MHLSLSGLSQPVVAPAAPIPAVNPKKSVFPDYIICLEDGKKFKSLKRHLSTDFGLTPEEYRTKWGLPRDYRMVAPNYAAQRSALAKHPDLVSRLLPLGRQPPSGRRKLSPQST